MEVFLVVVAVRSVSALPSDSVYAAAGRPAKVVVCALTKHLLADTGRRRARPVPACLESRCRGEEPWDTQVRPDSRVAWGEAPGRSMTKLGNRHQILPSQFRSLSTDSC